MVQVSQMHVWLTSVLRVYVDVACVDEGLVLLPDTLAIYLIVMSNSNTSSS
jgi:hypothetical protein